MVNSVSASRSFRPVWSANFLDPRIRLGKRGKYSVGWRWGPKLRCRPRERGDPYSQAAIVKLKGRPACAPLLPVVMGPPFAGTTAFVLHRRAQTELHVSAPSRSTMCPGHAHIVHPR